MATKDVIEITPERLALYCTVIGICLVGGAYGGAHYANNYRRKRTYFNLGLTIGFICFEISATAYLLMSVLRTEKERPKASFLQVVRFYKYPVLPYIALFFQNLSTSTSTYQALYLTCIILKTSTQDATSKIKYYFIYILNHLMILSIVLQYIFFSLVMFLPTITKGIIDLFSLFTLMVYVISSTGIFSSILIDLKYIHQIKSELYKIRQAGKDGTPNAATRQYERKIQKTIYGSLSFLFSIVIYITINLTAMWPFDSFLIFAWLLMLFTGSYARVSLVDIVNDNPMDSAKTEKKIAQSPLPSENKTATLVDKTTVATVLDKSVLDNSGA
ncbi:hypothetical protein BKA69DRAFT_1122345 [Paraphysoderma sedebokerense]|nr:hypothetical protein BKA69DRAFT_1122345 [Paraphysoderma sedebokerense]